MTGRRPRADRVVVEKPGRQSDLWKLERTGPIIDVTFDLLLRLAVLLLNSAFELLPIPVDDV